MSINLTDKRIDEQVNKSFTEAGFDLSLLDQFRSDLQSSFSTNEFEAEVKSLLEVKNFEELKNDENIRRLKKILPEDDVDEGLIPELEKAKGSGKEVQAMKAIKQLIEAEWQKGVRKRTEEAGATPPEAGVPEAPPMTPPEAAKPPEAVKPVAVSGKPKKSKQDKKESIEGASPGNLMGALRSAIQQYRHFVTDDDDERKEIEEKQKEKKRKDEDEWEAGPQPTPAPVIATPVVESKRGAAAAAAAAAAASSKKAGTPASPSAAAANITTAIPTTPAKAAPASSEVGAPATPPPPPGGPGQWDSDKGAFVDPTMTAPGSSAAATKPAAAAGTTSAVPAKPLEVKAKVSDEVDKIKLITGQLEGVIKAKNKVGDASANRQIAQGIFGQIKKLPDPLTPSEPVGVAIIELNAKLMDALKAGIIQPEDVLKEGILEAIWTRVHPVNVQAQGLAPNKQETLNGFNESYTKLESTVHEAAKAKKEAAPAAPTPAGAAQAATPAATTAAPTTPTASAPVGPATPSPAVTAPAPTTATPTHPAAGATPVAGAKPAAPAAQATTPAATPAAPTTPTASVPVGPATPAPATPTPTHPVAAAAGAAPSAGAKQPAAPAAQAGPSAAAAKTPAATAAVKTAAQTAPASAAASPVRRAIHDLFQRNEIAQIDNNRIKSSLENPLLNITDPTNLQFLQFENVLFGDAHDRKVREEFDRIIKEGGPNAKRDALLGLQEELLVQAKARKISFTPRVTPPLGKALNGITAALKSQSQQAQDQTRYRPEDLTGVRKLHANRSQSDITPRIVATPAQQNRLSIATTDQDQFLNR